MNCQLHRCSIPSEDPYKEAARQLLEQAPHSTGYVPDPMELEDHVPVYIPEPEHPEDLVPAEDEAPTPPLPPSFLSLCIRPPHTKAVMAQMRAAAPSTYRPLLPSRTPPLLPIPLPVPSTSRRADIPEADTPPRKRLLLTTPRPGCELGESSAAAAARQPGPIMARRVDCSSVDTVETRVRDTERRMMTLTLASLGLVAMAFGFASLFEGRHRLTAFELRLLDFRAFGGFGALGERCVALGADPRLMGFYATFFIFA
ncbi:hypothetical protein Tco_0411274 [Tanacetum coccineum]